MLTISNKLFESWNKADLLYCHWKSNEHLVPGLDGDTDLDVLLSPNDKEKTETILRSLDFLKCKSQFGSTYPNVDDWIGYDRATGKLIHLHLHYKIITGHKGQKEYSLPWTDLALATRILDTDTGIYIMEPNLEFLTLYTRIALKISIDSIVNNLFGRYSVSKDYLVEIDWLKKRINWEKVEGLVKEYYKSDADETLRIMHQESINPKAAFRLRKIAEKRFHGCNRNGRLSRIIELYYLVAGTLRSIARHKWNVYLIKRKVPFSQQGLLIAFLGQDGAGKTTVTNDLLKWLSWKMDVQYIYLGSGDNYFSWRKKLYKMLPNNKLFKIPRALLTFSKFSKLAKDVNKYIEKGEKFANKGGFVIFDRFPQARYPDINDGPKLRSNIVRNISNPVIQKFFLKYADREECLLAKAASHRPNIVFKLILSPEESLRRKPFEDIDVVRTKHNIIKSLEFEGSDVYLIDATMPYEEEILMIKTIIWDHIQK